MRLETEVWFYYGMIALGLVGYLGGIVYLLMYGAG